MAAKDTNLNSYLFLFAIVLVSTFFYQRYQNKWDRQNNDWDDYYGIQQYLLRDDDLVKQKKPILWIHIEREYNSRNWTSFGSRSSLDLNQPYLYLTVKSIIHFCHDSFHICIIDDDSFGRLMPEWKHHKNLANPVAYYVRELAFMKLIHKYGGIRVPASFICMRDLIDMYEMGTRNDKMFVCEMVDRNVTSTHRTFCANIRFMGARAANAAVGQLIEFIQKTISADQTDETWFIGRFTRWCDEAIENGRVKLIDGKLIGTKTIDDEPIIVDQLIADDYLDIYSNTFGIYIPAREILNRRHYEWFARLSEVQVLQSNLIVSKYLLLSNSPDAKMGVIEPMRKQHNWVGFWQVPSDAPLYGLKPNFLGDNLRELKYPTN